MWLSARRIATTVVSMRIVIRVRVMELIHATGIRMQHIAEQPVFPGILPLGPI